MSEGGGRWWLLGGGGKWKPPSKTCVHACVRGWWEVVVARWWWQTETTLENEHTHTLVLEGGSAKWGLVSAKTKQMKSMQAYLCTCCDLSSWSVSGSWSVCNLKGMVEWEGGPCYHGGCEETHHSWCGNFDLDRLVYIFKMFNYNHTRFVIDKYTYFNQFLLVMEISRRWLTANWTAVTVSIG